MDLHDLVRRLLGVVVEVGGRSVVVEPPKVRTALILLASMPGALSGDEGDVRVFRAGATEWLPPAVYMALPRETFVPAVWAIFERAAHLPERTASSGSTSVQVDWVALVADYRSAFPGDPMDEPWPIFMALLPQVARLRAVAKSDFIDAYASMKSKDGAKRIRQIYDDAYPGKRDEAKAAPEFMTDEWVAEQIAIAKQTRANARS